MRTVIIIVLHLVFPFLSKAQEGQFHDSHLDSSKSKQHRIVLAMEYCPDNKYSFCRDNGDQTYRTFYPHFIVLHSDILDANYEDVFILLDSKRVKSYDDIEAVNNLRKKLYGLVSSENLICIYNRKLKRKVRKFMNDSGGRNIFDGKFYYALFEIEFTCTYSQKQNYLIPNFYKYKEGLVIPIRSNTYHMTNIKSIRPISGKKYINEIGLEEYQYD